MINHIINSLKTYLINRQYTEALACLGQLLEKDSDNYLWHALAAETYANTGEIAKAIQFAKSSLAIQPNQETLELGLIQWSAYLSGSYLNHVNSLNKWGDKYYPSKPGNDHLKIRRPNEKIKIAYISGDLKNHSVRYFIEPFLRFHDRRKFEVMALMTMDEDGISVHLKSLVDQWHNVKNLTDDELHAFIQQCEIDVLVDLSGHTKGNRLRVFAMRAAPIQMTWFGDMSPLGIKAIDYRITDWGMCPAGSEALYREKLLRLETMVCYMPLENCEQQFPAPYKKNGHVTMISLNHSRKLNDETLGLWCEILNENQNCGLIVISSDERQPDGEFLISQRLKKLNAPMHKIAVMPRLSMLDFMHLAYAADFALDPFPISGGTTTLHSLWMGLPILTLQVNDSEATHTCASQTLAAVGLRSCVSFSKEEYKHKAKYWIENPETINSLRQTTRSLLQSSALMNYPARVSELESAYLKVCSDYAKSK